MAQPRPLAEILNPRVTPEMGFQSYESIAGDGDIREQQKAAFLAGEILNPITDYPKLNVQELQQGIRKLNEILSIANDQSDPEVRSAVWDSAAYRMAEMYWLLSCEKIINTYHQHSDEEIDLMVTRTQELNEQLYGRPETDISDSVVSEVWSQIDTKEFSGDAAKIKQELESGTIVDITGQKIVVEALQRTGNERLPQFPKEMLAVLKEKLYTDNQDIVDLIQDYWENYVQQRPETERELTPRDMFSIFKTVHASRDPENKSGVDVILDPSATVLSWETPLMAVKIGGRRPTIDDPTTALAKVFHEYVVHGGRSVNGSQTNLPVLGSGLFTEADPGEMSDYLTFEEGFAGMCEVAISNEKIEWKPVDIEKPLALALAYEGRDFRQTYEILWRARVLMVAKSGVEPSSDTIDKAKRNSYESALRVFRGTPTEMPRRNANGEPRILTYNKDLAYLKGKLQVVEFWKRYGADPEMLDLVFKAKFDPMNRRQLAIVKKAFGLAT